MENNEKITTTMFTWNDCDEYADQEYLDFLNQSKENLEKAREYNRAIEQYLEDCEKEKQSK